MVHATGGSKSKTAARLFSCTCPKGRGHPLGGDADMSESIIVANMEQGDAICTICPHVSQTPPQRPAALLMLGSA